MLHLSDSLCPEYSTEMAWPSYLPALKPWTEFSRPFVPWRKFVAEMPEEFDDETRELRLPIATQIDSYLTELRQAAENVPTDVDTDRAARVRAMWVQRQRLMSVLLRDEICRNQLVLLAILSSSPSAKNWKEASQLSELRKQENFTPGTATEQIIEHLQQHFASAYGMKSLIEPARSAPEEFPWLVEAEACLAALAPLQNAVVDAYAGLAAICAAQYKMQYSGRLNFRSIVEAGVTGVHLACESLMPCDNDGFLKSVQWWIRNRVLQYMLACWDMTASEIDAIAHVRAARRSLLLEDQSDMQKIADVVGFSPDYCQMLLNKRPKRNVIPVTYEGLCTLF